MMHIGSLWIDAREVLAAVGTIAIVVLLVLMVFGVMLFYWIVSANKGGKGTP